MVWGLCIALIAGIERHAVACAFSQIPFAWSLYRIRRSIPPVCLYLLAAGLFYLYGWLDTSLYHRGADAFVRTSRDVAPIPLRGWISSYPRLKGGSSIFSLRTAVIDRDIDIGLSVQGFDLEYGDSLRVLATVPATNLVDEGTGARRARFMRSKARMGFARAKARHIHRIPGTNGSFLVKTVFWPLHASIRNSIVGSMGDRSGIPLALVLGDKSRMRTQDSRAITALGISHLFALSGLHLGLVLGIVLTLIRPLRHGTTLLLTIILGLYVGTVGDIVSLQRAYTMVVIGCAVKKLQRPIRPISILCRALMLLLLIEPGSFYSVGFQLSFLATYAVLLCVERMNLGREPQLWKRRITYIWASLNVSFHAQLFITPLALRYFGESSLITPLSTILFLPLVFMLLLCSGICCIAGVISPSLGFLVYGWLGRGTDLFSVFLGVIASVAPSPWRAEAPSLVVYYAGLAIIFGVRRGRVWKIVGWAVTAVSFYWNDLWFLP